MKFLVASYQAHISKLALLFNRRTNGNWMSSRVLIQTTWLPCKRKKPTRLTQLAAIASSILKVGANWQKPTFAANSSPVFDLKRFQKKLVFLVFASSCLRGANHNSFRCSSVHIDSELVAFCPFPKTQKASHYFKCTLKVCAILCAFGNHRSLRI